MLWCALRRREPTYLCAMFIKPGRGRWEAAACKLEDNVGVEGIGREEEQVKVSTLRDGGGARGGGPSVHGGSIYQGRGEDEVRRTRKRPIGARGRHLSRPGGG